MSLLAGLVGYYASVSGSQYIDALGNSCPITLIGGPPVVEGFVEGEDALSLDGATQYGRFSGPNVPLITNTGKPYSVSLWVNWNATGGTSSCCFSIQAAGNALQWLLRRIAYSTTAGIYFEAAAYSNQFSKNGSKPVFDGHDHHIAFTDDGQGHGILYVDAAVDLAFTYTVSSSFTAPYQAIGARWSGGTTVDSFLTGKLGSIGLWRRAISPQEVAQVRNGGNGLAFPFGVRRVGQTMPRVI
jgi:Concanavalin A-like lectin/glucanases superfamily